MEYKDYNKRELCTQMINNNTNSCGETDKRRKSKEAKKHKNTESL